MSDGQVLLFGAPVDLSALIVALVIACLVAGYLLGAYFSTRGMRPARTPKRFKEDGAVFLKSINSLLANDTDKAIAELTRAVNLDPETVETYIALGHLFRSKGQFDRAIGIRQSIIARSNLPPALKVQALFDLGVDYRHGGFISRAVETLEEVLKEDAKHLGAAQTLGQIFEEIGEWEKALDIQKRVEKLTGQAQPERLAHLKAEQGKQLMAEGRMPEAKAAFKKALSWDKGSVNGLLSLGDLFLAQGDYKQALNTWRKVAAVAPKLCFLAIERVAGREWGAKESAAVEGFLLGAAAESKDPWSHLLAARYLAARGKEEETIAALRQGLKLAPDFLPAHRELGQILLDRGQMDEILSGYKDLLDRLPGKDLAFQCRQCGFYLEDYSWKCPSCRRWGTIELID